MTRPLPSWPAPHWAELIDAQAGVLGRQQALHGGLTPEAWRWRLTSGRWQCVLPAVIVAHTGEVTPLQRAWAAVVYAGEGAALSGDSALIRHGMRLDEPSVLHLALPPRRLVRAQELAGQGVRVVPHRIARVASWLHPVRRPPCLHVAPALLHAAAWAASDRAAEWRVAAAVQQRLVRVVDVRRALDSMPRLHRRRLLRTVLDDVELGAHAASELEFLRFLRVHELPRPDRLQRPVRFGTLRYLDAGWDRRRVAAEIDGSHHRSVAAWEADVLRANDVLLGGGGEQRRLLLRFTMGNLRHDGARCAAQLQAALR